MDSDLAIRNAAVDHCSALTAAWGDAVQAGELTKGFAFEGQQVKLVSWGRGIFKPEQLGDGPLTLVSSLGSSYADECLDSDAMLYDYAPPGDFLSPGARVPAPVPIDVECLPGAADATESLPMEIAVRT